MKLNVVLEYQDRQKTESELVKGAEQVWKDAGRKVSDIKKIELYVKPEDSKTYIVINDEFSSDFDI
ncbi:MAG: DUF6465 family protein [Lachnospiraceae bacterium]|nr:DUF6465 family protein [Lachnospiraceae bacterium]